MHSLRKRMASKTVNLSPEDFTEFQKRVQVLQSTGYKFDHNVERLEDGTFDILVDNYEDHDWDHLDKLHEQAGE